MKTHVRGFTLIELMVVIAIIGILGCIAVPSFMEAMANHSLRAAARDLSSLLRKGRAKAIKEQRDVIIDFVMQSPGDKTDGWYLFDHGKIFPSAGTIGKQYGGGVHFGFGKAKKGASSTGKLPADPVTFQGQKIQFNAMGLCTAGYVYLSNSKGTAMAIGANSTGVLMYKQWNGTEWK